jgi:CRISPR-associated protein Csb1
MSDPIQLNDDFFDHCVRDPSFVALHLQECLVPIEGKDESFFPPTFATSEKGKEGPYAVDILADGTKVVLVDSVGSQANRMEPLFLNEDLRALVPQVQIRYADKKAGIEGSVSLLEAGHRLGDALVRCTALAEEANAAFLSQQRGDAEPLAKLAPTSLVFGAWDSRETGTKVPRIVQSSIRAWNTSELRRSAQYFPAIDYKALGLVTEKEDNGKSDVAARGYAAVPARDNPGGVVAHGEIRRHTTVNLIALRRLNAERRDELRRYLLGLSLVAAGEPQDPFLRQGCVLVPDIEQPPAWSLVRRDGTRLPIAWSQETARAFATAAAEAFGVGEDRDLEFDKKLANADKKKKKGE